MGWSRGGPRHPQVLTLPEVGLICRRFVNSPFCKGVGLNQIYPGLPLSDGWPVRVCLIHKQSRFPRSTQGGLTRLSMLSQCVPPEAGGCTAGHLSLSLFSSPQPSLLSGGRHSDPLGADLCLVHMRLSVGTPPSRSRGPGLASSSPPVTLAGSEGRVCRRVHSHLRLSPPVPWASPVAGPSSRGPWGGETCRLLQKIFSRAGHGSISHSTGSPYHANPKLLSKGRVHIPPLDLGSLFCLHQVR